MENELTLRYDRRADVLHVDTSPPYPEQEVREIGEGVVARLNPVVPIVEGLDIRDFSRRLRLGTDALVLPVQTDLRLPGRSAGGTGAPGGTTDSVPQGGASPRITIEPERVSVPDPFRDIGVDEVPDLSTRACSVMQHQGIRRLGDLDGLRPEAMERWENCGRITRMQIEEALGVFDGVRRRFVELLRIRRPEEFLRIPEHLHDLAVVDLVSLSVRARNAMWRAGYRRLGELDGLHPDAILEWEHVGRRTQREIEKAIRDLASGERTLPTVPSDAWGAARRHAFLEGLPTHLRDVAMGELDGLSDRGDSPNPVRDLPAVARAYFGAFAPRRGYEVLRLRYGLDGAPAETFEAIGQSLGVTRELVRQVNVRAMMMLEGGLRAPEGLHGLSAGFREEVSALRASLETLPWLVPEHRLIELVGKRYGELEGEGTPELSFLLDVLGWVGRSGRSMGLDPGTQYRESPSAGAALHAPMWTMWTRKRSNDIPRIVSAMRERLRRSIPGTAVEPLRDEVGSKLGGVVAREWVATLLQLMPDVELLGDDFVRLRFEALPNHADQACRVLHDHGAPLHFREIAEGIDRRLSRSLSQPRGRAVHLRPHLRRDPRFLPVGKSGRWGLTEWAEGPGG